MMGYVKEIFKDYWNLHWLIENRYYFFFFWDLFLAQISSEERSKGVPEFLHIGLTNTASRFDETEEGRLATEA